MRDGGRPEGGSRIADLAWLADGWAGRVERTSVADAVYESLRSAIVEGRLAAATRLGEKELALQFRVSRTPVREALRRLEQRRLVTALPTGGYLVASWDAADVHGLYRVRAALERLVTGEAAIRATRADIEQLARLVDAPAVRVPGETVGRRFHQAVAQIAGIRLAADLLDQVADQEDRFRPGGCTTDRRERAAAEHRRVLEQLRAGDRHGAETAIDEHLQQAEASLAMDLGGASGHERAGRGGGGG